MVRETVGVLGESSPGLGAGALGGAVGAGRECGLAAGAPRARTADPPGVRFMRIAWRLLILVLRTRAGGRSSGR